MSRDKLMETLDVLSHEDPTFTFRDDSETGQLVISGMGELHLDVLVTRIRDDFKVQCRVGAPQVTYRESISSSCDYAEEYSRIKKEGAALYPYDIEKYIEHKASFIERIYKELGV